MKKKILTAVFSSLLLILPTVVAVTSYLSAQRHPVTRRAVSQIVVSMPEGKEYTFSRSDETTSESGIFDRLFAINDAGKAVASLPAAESTYTGFTAEYTSYNRKSLYKYYFTSDPNNAYYRDAKGNYFKISPAAASAFLSTEYAVFLYPSAVQPELSVASQKVLPQRMEWKFLSQSGQFVDSMTDVSEEVPSCSVSGGLQLSFDTAPDYLYVTMKDGKGVTVFEDSYENMDPALFSDNTVYDVSVEAKWYQAEGRENYGEATYRFKANVQSPAVFYLSTPAIEYGDFVIVSGKNIVDPNQIVFTATPEINFQPTFFEYGGYYHALIPISLDCIKANDSASHYTFTLAYAGAYQELALDVTVRKGTTAYPTFTKNQIETYRNEVTLKQFDDTMKSVFSAKKTRLFFMEDNMLISPSTGSVKHGFGCNIILSATKTNYTHLGVDFRVSANEAVHACLPGEVTFVGETTLSGNTVVVDHGGGLTSLYAHLSSASVKVGDVIDKNEIVGIVGSTGFCTGRTLHFGLYVFGVPVRYYSYEENGINVAEAVAQEMSKS